MKVMNLNKITQGQRKHWKELAHENAGSVHAVGSESLEHKHLRYEKLLNHLVNEEGFSLHEIGPGVGDFYGFLQERHPKASTISYSASEITSEYCDIARQSYPGIDFYERDILSGTAVDEKYDFVILSGVFHQQSEVSHRYWIEYMQQLLKAAWNMTEKGLGFNVLTSYADYYKPGNFYADLTELQLFVVRQLSRFFNIDCSYPLFEATVYVNRLGCVKEEYCGSQWSKYLKDDY